jgi:hypothetical protein
VFKIPHHGSQNAHNDQVWSELLHPNPPAMIAPWRLGDRSLPTVDDIVRIQRMTNNLYVTTIPQNHKKTRQFPVQNMVDATVKSIRKVDECFGHIRLRAKFGTADPVWEVALFHGAKKIQGRMARAFPKS